VGDPTLFTRTGHCRLLQADSKHKAGDGGLSEEKSRLNQHRGHYTNNAVCEKVQKQNGIDEGIGSHLAAPVTEHPVLRQQFPAYSAGILGTNA